MSSPLKLRNLHGFIVVEKYAEQQQDKFGKLLDTLTSLHVTVSLSRLKRFFRDNNRTASIIV